MKRTVFGVLLMAIGTALLIVGTTLFTVSAKDVKDAEQAFETKQQENQVYAGEYYQNGDSTKSKVVISDGSIILTDGTVAEYILSVWKNMPETDEESGRITYKDYCFLKLDSGKLSYDPMSREVVIDGVAYRML